jgi:1-acyl-sn-glycerol-3-phosphate acyltransferase
MSAALGSSPAGTVPTPSLWMAPVAVWRLLRVLLHLLIILLQANTIWRVLDRAALDVITVRWSGKLLRILGIKLVVQGQARPGAKLVVSNHVSWLDIVAINSVIPSRFVSKAEVGQWPLVGPLVTAAGTLYLVRERRRDAMRVLGLMAKAMQDGHTVAVFPEGTTGKGHGVMHFHANMLQAAIDAPASVQPVVLRYSDPRHAISPVAAYEGDTSLLQSLWWVVTARGLTVHVQVLPLQAAAHADRRALADLLHTQIAQTLSDQLPGAAIPRE